MGVKAKSTLIIFIFKWSYSLFLTDLYIVFIHSLLLKDLVTNFQSSLWFQPCDYICMCMFNAASLYHNIFYVHYNCTEVWYTIFNHCLQILEYIFYFDNKKNTENAPTICNRESASSLDLPPLKKCNPFLNLVHMSCT